MKDKIFLGMESSTDMISLAALRRDKFIFSFKKKIERGASQMPVLCSRLFKKYSLSLNDCEAVLVGAGPGSFTGLRIAYSLAKGWHCALGLTVKGRSSFDSMALQVKERFSKIAVIADARRNLIYGVTFLVRQKSLIKEGREQLCPLSEFVSGKEEYVFVSYDLHLRDKALALNPDLRFYEKQVWPLIMPLLAEMPMVYNKKKRVFTPNMEPLYIYPENCQVRNV